MLPVRRDLDRVRPVLTAALQLAQQLDVIELVIAIAASYGVIASTTT